VIANAASSAPDPQTTSTSPEPYDDEEAVRQTEEFLASLMQETYAREDGTYAREVFANMLTDDDLWMLSDTASPSGKDAVQDGLKLSRVERLSLVLPVIPTIAHPTFWELEHDKLQQGRDGFVNVLPSPQALEAQFLEWERKRMPNKREVHEESSSSTEPRHRTSQTSSVFDDSYSFGKLTQKNATMNLKTKRSDELLENLIKANYKYEAAMAMQSEATNKRPALPKEIPLSYVKAFASDLITVADIDRRETLIYKEGRTPAALRSGIKSALRSALPDKHLKEFNARHIPPAQRDPQTHMVLHALLLAQNHHKGKTESSHSGKAHNDTNRTMYKIYSDDVFPFFQYMTIILRNTASQTYAISLQKLQLNSKNYGLC
jgi:hypothetical protein